MGKKRDAPEPAKPAKQRTLDDAFSKRAKPQEREMLPPPCFEEQEYAANIVSEKLFSTARPMYEKYCNQSALMKGATEADPGLPPKPSSKKATRSRAKLEEDPDTEEEADLPSTFDPSWEANGLQFVSALEPLVSVRHSLPKYLQEFLVHIMLNHARHRTNLSLRALKLLQHNAKMHPPCSIPEGGPPGLLRVNRELWVPSLCFRFEGLQCPPVLTNKTQLDLFLELWRHAHQWSLGSMEGVKTRAKGVSPGYILLLQYCMLLIQLDLDTRMALVHGPRCRGFAKVERVMKGSVLWQTLSTGVGGGSVHLMWHGSSRNSVALLQSVVLTYLGAIQGPWQQHARPHSRRASQPMPTPTPQGAATPHGGATPGAHAHAPQPTASTVSLSELGTMAARMLRAWQQMYALADTCSGELYTRSDKGTDHYFMCQMLHDLLTGHSNNQDQDPLARMLDRQLKDEKTKLALLSVIAPNARLTLLGLQFLDMAATAWTSYAQSSSSKAVEGVGVCQLPPSLAQLQDYREKKGLERPAMSQVDPLQLLACLAPSSAVQEAAASLPYLGTALKGGVSDLYNQAKKKLLKVDTGRVKDCSGFTLWLSALIRAAEEEEEEEADRADPKRAAALRTLVTGLCRRMDADSKDSSFEDTLQAKMAKQAMQRSLGMSC